MGGLLSYRRVSGLRKFKMTFDTCKRRVSINCLRYFFVFVLVRFLSFFKEHIVIYRSGF